MLTGRLDRLNPDCYINDFKAVYVFNHLLSGKRMPPDRPLCSPLLHRPLHRPKSKGKYTFGSRKNHRPILVQVG